MCGMVAYRWLSMVYRRLYTDTDCMLHVGMSDATRPREELLPRILPTTLRDSTEGCVCSRFELVVEVSISSLGSGLVNVQWSMQWRNSGVKLQWIELGIEQINGT